MQGVQRLEFIRLCRHLFLALVSCPFFLRRCDTRVYVILSSACFLLGSHALILEVWSDHAIKNDTSLGKLRLDLAHIVRSRGSARPPVHLTEIEAEAAEVEAEAGVCRSAGMTGVGRSTGAFPYHPQCAHLNCRYISVVHDF